MCGLCKGLEFYCEACGEFPQYNKQHDNYKYCANVGNCSSQICDSCFELYGVTYCGDCIIDEKFLELKIDELEAENEILKKLIIIHEVYKNILKRDK